MKNSKAFTVLEMLVVTLILSVVMSAVYMLLNSGRNSWSNVDGDIQLQENLRQVIERVTREIHQADSMHIQVNQGTGYSNTDVIDLSMPVICQASESLLDVNGDVKFWRAPLTWGCTTSACMDADDDCATVDYAVVEYRVNSDNQLVRRVLNGGGGVVREDIFATGITDFQAEMSGRLINITAEIRKTTKLGRDIQTQASINLYLRN